MFTTKKLFKLRHDIRSMARKLGFKHLRVRPPILSSLKEPFEELYFIATVKGEYKPSNQFMLESKLKTLLGVEVHVETEDDIEIASSDLAIERRYNKLEGAAIYLKKLKEKPHLETQWRKSLQKKGYSFADPDFAEFLVATSTLPELSQSKAMTQKKISEPHHASPATQLLSQPRAKMLPFFKEKPAAPSSIVCPQRSHAINKKDETLEEAIPFPQ